LEKAKKTSTVIEADRKKGSLAAEVAEPVQSERSVIPIVTPFGKNAFVETCHKRC
jgi:hypothetical protein